MAIVCSICEDYLTDYPQILPVTQELLKVALPCGHLFHHPCIKEWFSRSKTTGCFSGFGVQQELKGACPLCWKNVSLNTDALRIYPTTDEDGDRMAQQVKELECVTVDNHKLVVDMEQLRQQLEQERAAHERLRLQHAATALQLNNMREDDEIQSAIKKSFKSGLQKSERERKEALQKLAKMELKDLDSRKRIEQLEKEVEKYKREVDRAKRNAIPRRYAVSSDSSDNEYSSQQNSLSYFRSQIP